MRPSLSHREGDTTLVTQSGDTKIVRSMQKGNPYLTREGSGIPLCLPAITVSNSVVVEGAIARALGPDRGVQQWS